MEPLRAIMETLERKMKCKWREKTVCFKDGAHGWTSIEAEMVPQLLTVSLYKQASITAVHLCLC